jgi:hypothetical protein
MNPDPAKRGAELGRENAEGGQSIGTGGHGTSWAKICKWKTCEINRFHTKIQSTQAVPIFKDPDLVSMYIFF